VVLRFVVGSVKDPAQDAQLRAEQQQHGDVLRLPLEVSTWWQPQVTFSDSLRSLTGSLRSLLVAASGHF